MNANELADLIERCNDWGYNQDAANMLRQMGLAESIIKQQQAEIDTYKLQNDNQIDTYKYKELTNEEISDIRDQFFAPDGCNIYTFARALLKKASEI